MHISTYSDDKAQVDINKLINNGGVKQYSGRVGCCIRNYLIFEKDNHKYYYNPNKLISDTLRKKLFNHLYNMSPKRLNKKTTTIDSIEAELKHDRGEKRYFVNKDRFDEFINEHNDIQATETNEVSVQLNIIVELKDVEANEYYTKDIWIPMTTIYGGVNGVKMFIKSKIVDIVYVYEGSNAEIQKILLKKLYMLKKKQDIKADIKKIKMYGTIFNYKGYGLDALNGKIQNACVPEYLKNLYNNENETNPRKRLKKLTIEKIVEELGMKSIDDGCSTEQIRGFCNNHKITYYALDYKYKLFDTNNDMNYNSNLPRLVYMCATNHLFPIRDEAAREFIFKSCSNLGGGMKKYKTQQKNENINLQISKYTRTYVYTDGMNFYALFQKVQQLKIGEPDYDYRNILTINGSCHSIFHDELKRGNIHNGRVRISDNNKIVGFDMGCIALDENPNYEDIKITIDTLNEKIEKDAEKYNYTGQSHHSLAYQYFTNNYDENILSVCSPQSYELLTSKLFMNSAFLEFYKNNCDIAFDINKQYTNILLKCDKFGWSKFTPMDEVKPFDGNIDTGIYYVETNNYFPLKGNGWYFDDTIEKSLQYKIINHDDIKYQLKPSYVLSSNHFETFIYDVYDKFEPIHENGGKLAINCFI